MIATTIAFVLSNVPAWALIAAVIMGLVGRPRSAERALAWMLLLPIGLSGIWGAIFHLFFPAVAAADIGWAVSPFQFEVGVADLAVGVVACLAFRASLPFKAAAVFVASIALLGDAVGHVHQMMSTGNFAPGNAGVPFWTDVIVPVLSLLLLALAWRRR